MLFLFRTLSASFVNMRILHVLTLISMLALNVAQLQRYVYSGVQSHNTKQMIVSAIFDMLRASVVLDRQKRTFNLFVKAVQPECFHIFGDISDELMRHMSSQIAVRIGWQRSIGGDNERHYGILLVDSAESLDFLYSEFWNYHLHIRGFYIIFLHNPLHHYSDDLHEILVLNWKIGVVDANVLIHALPDLILLFTDFPYTPYHCAGIAPVIINKYTKSRWESGNFFPDKLENLYGCPLVLATWEELPYFVVNMSEKYGQQDHYIGIEGKMLELLMFSFNFTVQFRWMDDDEIDRTLEEDGAIFNELFKNGTDFVIGAFRYKPTSSADFYAPTTGYYHSTFDIIVSAIAEPYSPFTKLLFPFVIEVWFVLFVIFVMGITLIVFTTFMHSSQKTFILGNKNHTPIYNMFVVTLGGSLSSLPRRNFARFLLYLWIIASLVLRSSYQAFLYHYIRTDIHMPPPNTIHDILVNNYSLLMTEFTLDAIKNLPHISERAVMLNGTEYDNFEMLRRSDVKEAILTPYEYFGHFKRTHLHNEDFYVIPQSVFTQQLSIYMRKSSIFLSNFNQDILNFNSFGLLKKTENDFVDTVRNVRNFNGDERPQRMNLTHLYAANAILVFGCALGSLALICELFVNCVGGRDRKRRRRSCKQMKKSRSRRRYKEKIVEQI